MDTDEHQVIKKCECGEKSSSQSVDCCPRWGGAGPARGVTAITPGLPVLKASPLEGCRWAESGALMSFCPVLHPESHTGVFSVKGSTGDAQQVQLRERNMVGSQTPLKPPKLNRRMSGDITPCQPSPPPRCDLRPGGTAPGQTERSPRPPPHSRCGSPTRLTEEEQDSEEGEVNRGEGTQSNTGDTRREQ